MHAHVSFCMDMFLIDVFHTSGTHREQEWVIFSSDIELSRDSAGAPAVWNGPSNSSPADVLRAKGAAGTESWNVEVRRVPATGRGTSLKKAVFTSQLPLF